jgi:hypothetical protein
MTSINEGGKGGGGMVHVSQQNKTVSQYSRALEKQFHISRITRL